uniref:uncharacterized protein LOC120811188 isoform X1 n=1 Tax=Gasterosteus aculeatus aculeatus TaxID=481459 RepID=UPI001A99A95A|nr:uncharacterized protein LOC120811188 isoform X1 [Gasterosteus aculeatus aculeatus]XP_040022335.1 uncharacterized protein LOC120811188 isoform X1 [Gasterosteus aculeatus aculeatus]
MELMVKEEMRKKSKSFLLCFHLLTLLQLAAPSSAQNITTSAADGFRTHPADVTVAVGEPAVFRCGVPEASPDFTFTLRGAHGNYLLTCPSGHVEDVPQALYGSCEVRNGESSAVWTLKGTSFSDNGTQVSCQQPKNPNSAAAVLHVYDNGTSHAILIGCIIGGFFGTLLVFGLLERRNTGGFDHNSNKGVKGDGSLCCSLPSNPHGKNGSVKRFWTI